MIHRGLALTVAERERRRIAAPVLIVCIAAWVALMAWSCSRLTADTCCIHFVSRVKSNRLNVIPSEQLREFALFLGVWTLMLVAMMTPMLTEPIRHIVDHCFVKRRFRSLVLFLVAYFVVWITAAPLMLRLVYGRRSIFSDPVVQAGVAAALALAWQCSPAKQRFLNRLHSLPDLAAFGIDADMDAGKFGFTHGIKCFGSCWALMWFSEVCSVGHLCAMAVVTLWLVAEHLGRPAKPSWHLPHLTRATNILTWQFDKFFRGMSRAVSPSGALQRLLATLAESPDHSSSG